MIFDLNFFGGLAYSHPRTVKNISAIKVNYNFLFRCSFKPEFSKPVLPDISSDKGKGADEILTKESTEGLKDKFITHFKLDKQKIRKVKHFR